MVKKKNFIYIFLNRILKMNQSKNKIDLKKLCQFKVENDSQYTILIQQNLE